MTFAALLANLALFAAEVDGCCVEVLAGRHARTNCLVSVDLPDSLRRAAGLELVHLESGRCVPAQRDAGALYWLIDRLPAGAVVRYRLRQCTAQGPSGGVTVEDDGKRLVVKVDGKTALAYNHAVVPSPDPQEPYYARSGYLHPVFAPSGQLVTDDFNPDHAHQHGIMFAWRKMRFEGREVNGWDQKSQLGRVEHARLDGFGGGLVFGHFAAQLTHLDLTAPGGPKPALRETWRVRIHRRADCFVFDLEALQRSAGQQPVVVEKMHYGGLMVRGRADWSKARNYDFLTSEGLTRADGNGAPARWVDLHGPGPAQALGITVLSHPANFRAPQPVRLHPSMPYFCFAPSIPGDFSIEPKRPYGYRYRFVVHDGPMDRSAAERLWADYAEPPVVRTADKSQ